MSQGWRPLGWMIGVSVLGWLALAATGAAHPEALAGMLGPAAAAVASWIVMAGAARTGPEHLTRVMMLALALKMVWFGVYVAVALRVFDLRPLPFVAAFVGFFIVLYAMEAVYLRRLPTGSERPPQLS